MNYINPFHILSNHVRDGEKIDKALLKRVKKRLLSEFELMDSATILIGDNEFDKNAILQFFDKIEKDQALYQHWKIYQNKPLLEFLEKGDLTFFKRSNAIEEITSDEKLFHYIAPYLVEQFNDELYDAVRKNDIRQTRLLSKSIQALNNKQETNAYQKTYRYLRGRIQDLKLTVEDAKRPNQRVLDSEVDNFLHPSFMTVFNLLGDHYFERIRNEYAIELESLAINLHNTSRRTALAIECLEAGLELNLSEDTISRLNHVLKQLQTKNGKEIPKSKTGQRTSQHNKSKKKRVTEKAVFWIVQGAIVLWYLFKRF